MSQRGKQGRHVRLWDVLWYNFTATLERRWRNVGGAQSSALRRLARRPASISLRHLDCGSCNGCELELVALISPVYDIEQYGISFEPWPRNATHLVMTGVFTRGLNQPARETLEAMPEPAILAVGDCACGAGPFAASYANEPRPIEIEDAVVLRIPGCPPSPETILSALADWLRPADRGDRGHTLPLLQ